MEYLKFIAQSKGFSELPRRLMLIVTRFGFTEKRLKGFIEDADKLLKPYGVHATVFITAELLEKRPYILTWFKTRAWDTGIHGYSHVNYRALNGSEQFEHLKKAKKLLSETTSRSLGSRAPYLSRNNETVAALKRNGINWSSDCAVIWDCLNPSHFKQKYSANYHRAIETLYKPQRPSEMAVVPYFSEGLLEIPLSLPDDEILIDRLRISDPSILFEVWNNILVQTHRRGDLFTLLLHPERGSVYFKAIRSLLEKIRSKQEKIWIATLSDISDWWQERGNVRIEMSRTVPDQYRISVSGTERATIVLTKAGPPTCTHNTLEGKVLHIVEERHFVLTTSAKPIVGISETTSSELKAFLKNEGFFFEVAEKGVLYGFDLSQDEDLSVAPDLALLNQIENSPFPLVRIWRWPGKYTSAVSLTFDLDAVTVQDFVRRAFDFQTITGASESVESDRIKNPRPTACMLGYFNYKSDARVQNYVNFLKSSGFDVDIICLGKNDDYDVYNKKASVSVFPVKERTQKETTRASYFFNLLSFFFLAMVKVTSLFFRKKYKFVHVHNLPDFLVFTAWIPKLFGAKLILDIHDIFPELYARKFGASVGGFMFKVLLFIEKISCRFSNHTIIANDIWKDTVNNRVPLSDRCTTIPNFPDRKIFSFKGRGSEASSEPDKPFTIVYHGSLTEHHGIDIAINAMAILKDNDRMGVFQFLLYGSGQTESQNRALIKSLDLEDCVSMMGGVAFQDIPSILKKADMGVVPKKDGLFVGDALSTKLFEYAAMGVPAVVSRTPAEQRYFSEDEVLFFKAEDPKDLARCILELYENDDLRAIMVKKALKRMDFYNIKVNESKYLDIVNKL